MKLQAYRTNPVKIEIVPATPSRDWMDATDRFANRCLPMLMANQAGWFLLNPFRFEAVWNGGSDGRDIKVRGGKGIVTSHFGFGTITWMIPWLFRTEPGYNLLIRGIPNSTKDGINPLEGLVETDWSFTTFTMNWKFTRPDVPIVFEAGEPFCMILPQQRASLEGFTPEVLNIAEDEVLNAMFHAWSKSRSNFNQQLQQPGSEATQQEWQKDYFRIARQKKLDLKPFVEK